MSADQKTIARGSDREARVRVDAAKLARARALLAAIDGGLFAAAPDHSAAGHPALLARIVAELFADG